MTTSAPSDDPLGELFDRDPITLTEDELHKITRELVTLNRAYIDEFNKATAEAASRGKPISGTGLKSAQRKRALTLKQQMDTAQLPESSDDIF